MSGDQPVSRYEFETYKTLARELRDADRTEIARVIHDVELVEHTSAARLETLATEVDARFTAADLRTERKKEWSWQTKITVSGLAVAILGLWIQAIAAGHK